MLLLMACSVHRFALSRPGCKPERLWTFSQRRFLRCDAPFGVCISKGSIRNLAYVRRIVRCAIGAWRACAARKRSLIRRATWRGDTHLDSVLHGIHEAESGPRRYPQTGVRDDARLPHKEGKVVLGGHRWLDPRLRAGAIYLDALAFMRTLTQPPEPLPFSATAESRDFGQSKSILPHFMRVSRTLEPLRSDSGMRGYWVLSS